MRIHSVGLLSRVVGARIRGRRARTLVVGVFEALIASLLVLPTVAGHRFGHRNSASIRLQFHKPW